MKNFIFCAVTMSKVSTNLGLKQISRIEGSSIAKNGITLYIFSCSCFTTCRIYFFENFKFVNISRPTKTKSYIHLYVFLFDGSFSRIACKNLLIFLHEVSVSGLHFLKKFSLVFGPKGPRIFPK